MISNYKNIVSFKNFKNRNDQIGILERTVPRGASLFFQKLHEFPFSLAGNVFKNSAKDDIKKLLNLAIPKNIQCDLFYDNWLDDMKITCEIFCEIQEEDSISFWLGSERGCKRYHVDMVPYRLLVTYAGQGTELLPNEAANRNAFIEGKSNEQIIKDKSAIRYINKWDIAIFRGGENGILHRTPNSALDGSSSILMRLDHQSFYNEIKLINGFA